MQNMISKSAAGLACLILFSCAGAHADVKITQVVTLKNAQYAQMRESMDPQQLAAAHRSGLDLMMGIPQTSTMYVSGQKFRLDMASRSTIFDTAARTQTTINTTSKTYSTVSTADALTRPGAYTVKLTPAKLHKVIMGHPATAYSLTATSVSFPGQLVSGQIWSADDIKRPNLPSHGLMAQFSSMLEQVKGLPLIVNLKITGTSNGEIDLDTKVTSISQSRLGAGVFKVPAGYKPTSGFAPGASPLMGMGM